MVYRLSGFPIIISCRDVMGWCRTHAYPWGNHGIRGHAFTRLVVTLVLYGIGSWLHTPIATTFLLTKKKKKNGQDVVFFYMRAAQFAPSSFGSTRRLEVIFQTLVVYKSNSGYLRSSQHFGMSSYAQREGQWEKSVYPRAQQKNSVLRFALAELSIRRSTL